MQKQEKDTEKSKESKKKHKRKVSIFTVFLWLFLITTMSTITIGSLTKKNAIEVTDNDWNIQLVMYDRSSDTPNQAITDCTWNATSYSETKQLTMQINYACTTGKEYQPGEIIIEIPGIRKDSFSEWNRRHIAKMSNWLRDNAIIAADKADSDTKQYDWSYVYDEENNMFTFTNNMVIVENEHFEGTIQIVYNLETDFKIQTDLQFQAKIKENIESDEIIAMESNICNFHYTSTKRSYILDKRADVAPKIDYTPIEDILDDYYWVRYRFYVNNSDNGIIIAFDENNEHVDSSYTSKSINCIKEELPEGCILYDQNLNKIEPQEGNIYYYLQAKTNDYNGYYYIGYPKDKYQEGDSITNTAELWGRYEDEEEMQKLAEATIESSLVEFNFEYTGDLYSIYKGSDNYQEIMYSNKIKGDGNIVTWVLPASAFYTGSKMDVEIGDDLLYITRENGEVTKLEDNEYHFTSVCIPVFYTYNKYSGNRGDKLIGYEWELQVRYKNTNEYVTYKTGITGEGTKFSYEGGIYVENTLNDYIEFNNDNIIGIKVIIKDLDKTLYTTDVYRAYNYNNDIRVYTNVHTQNLEDEGKVYNFGYLQVYHKAEDGNRTLVNEPTLDNYNTLSTQLKIAEYDQVTYGTYMQRSYNTYDITLGRLNLLNRKEYGTIVNNNLEEKYEFTWKLRNNLSLINFDVDKEVIIKTYDILPNGINLRNGKNSIGVYLVKVSSRFWF